MTNHEQLWYLGYNYLRNVVNCWIKLLITIHMCYLGYNYLRNVVNCWIKLLITIQIRACRDIMDPLGSTRIW